MMVNYYEIYNCVFDMYFGRPALFAASDAPAELLDRYGFATFEDGRRVHFLDQQEYYHIMSCQGADPVVFNEATWYKISNYYHSQLLAGAGAGRRCYDDKEGNNLCIISLVLFLSALPMCMLQPFLGAGCELAAFILMIIVRVKHPKNVFGLVLMIIYIVAAVLLIIGAILLLAACYALLEEFNNCSIPC